MMDENKDLKIPGGYLTQKKSIGVEKNQSVTILVVEDSRTQAEALKYVLEKHNFRVDAAGDGEEALGRIKQNRPTIVVSDILMPKMDGYELCRQIKVDKNLRQIPVVLLTALSDPKDVVRGLEVGADNFITKPFDEEYLVSQIQYLLENPLPKQTEGAKAASIFFGGQKYSITSDRLQILNLLLSTYEMAVLKNKELAKVQGELIRLNEQLERQLHMLEQAQVLVQDTQGKIIFWNAGAERIYGYSKEEATGKESHQLLKTVFPKPLKEIENEVWQNGKWEGELIHTRKDGARVTVLSHWVPFYDAHNLPAAVIESNTDVSERKKTEEMLKLQTLELETVNRELEAFSFSVSHDLRAPLRGIDGFSQMLQEDYCEKLDDRGKEYLSSIRSSSQLMARLIDDILTISRITRAPIAMENVNLSELASEVVEELKRQQPERQVEFKITPGVTDYGDPNLLKLVFDNLLGNAFKFTGKRAEPVIEFGIKNDAGQQVYFVRDNGAGFDMAYADKLFKPFQRLHSVDDFPGTGIGLASVQRIINRHGGRVWAEGEVGEGATFYFTLG